MTTMQPTSVRSIVPGRLALRCPACGKLLAICDRKHFEGTLSIKCPRCSTLAEFGAAS